jgi:hypothetical protein
MNQELHVTDDLSAYLANELDQNERSRVELHLRDCESCQKELEKHKRLNEVLGGSQPISPSPEIIRGVMQQVQHEQKTIAFKRLLPWLAIAAVLVAVLFLLRIQKETPVPGEVVEKKNPPVIRPINPPTPAPKELPQTKIENPPVVKITPPREPIEKPEPETIPEETPQIAEQVNPQTSISPEDEEMIAKIDELENMDVISNYENLENLEVAIMDEGGGSQR